MLVRHSRPVSQDSRLKAPGICLIVSRTTHLCHPSSRIQNRDSSVRSPHKFRGHHIIYLKGTVPQQRTQGRPLWHGKSVKSLKCLPGRFWKNGLRNIEVSRRCGEGIHKVHIPSQNRGACRSLLSVQMANPNKTVCLQQASRWEGTQGSPNARP